MSERFLPVGSVMALSPDFAKRFGYGILTDPRADFDVDITDEVTVGTLGAAKFRELEAMDAAARLAWTAALREVLGGCATAGEFRRHLQMPPRALDDVVSIREKIERQFPGLVEDASQASARAFEETESAELAGWRACMWDHGFEGFASRVEITDTLMARGAATPESGPELERRVAPVDSLCSEPLVSRYRSELVTAHDRLMRQYPEAAAEARALPSCPPRTSMRTRRRWRVRWRSKRSAQVTHLTTRSLIAPLWMNDSSPFTDFGTLLFSAA